MKQYSYILNIVLLVAVAVLYYFHFKERKQFGSGTAGNNSIVYINSETLTDNYKLYIQKREELKADQEHIKQTLRDESAKLQSQVEDYQKKAATMSKVDRDATEKRLGQRQQELYMKRDSMTAVLEDRKDKINEQIYDHLTQYIKDYIKTNGKNYRFVLGYQKGGGIVFANDSLDVTHEILEGLNKEYDKENPLSK